MRTPRPRRSGINTARPTAEYPEPESAEKTKELIAKAKAGCTESRNRVVECHMRFVVKQAKSLMRPGRELQDLVQIGALALVLAIDKFDLSSPNGFLSYAAMVIRDQMLKRLRDEFNLIRLPEWAWILDGVHAKVANAMGLDPLGVHQEVIDETNRRRGRKTTPRNTQSAHKAREGVRVVAGMSQIEWDDGVKEALLEATPERPTVAAEEDPRLIALRKAMEHLSGERLEAVKAKFGFEGMSPKILAGQLGCCPRALRSVARAALKQLKSALT